MLDDQAAIVRQLRPIKRRVTSGTATLVDEDATAQRVADTRLWVPVLAPERGRWLDLHVVVDDSPSMAVWEPMTRSLVALFGRLGAFRKSTVWWMDSAGARVVLRSVGSAMHDPREVVDPTGHSVVVVLSDGIGPGWGSGPVGAALADWAAAGPVVIWQALTPRLWRRTAMRLGARRSPRPVPASRLPSIRSGRLGNRRMRTHRLGSRWSAAATGHSPRGPGSSHGRLRRDRGAPDRWRPPGATARPRLGL